ncbi:MAG: hypothetical protein CMF50_01630 [Legionellales bacterium]|mgnify:CR=1 FL=1|nr:hypothetical protein [Legionellales bacterium]
MTYPKITPEQREAIVNASRFHPDNIGGRVSIDNKTVAIFYASWLLYVPPKAIRQLVHDAPDSPAGVINCFHDNVEWETVSSLTEAAYHQALKIIYPGSTVEDVCYLFGYLEDQNSELTPDLLNNLAQVVTINDKFIGTLVTLLKADPEPRKFLGSKMEEFLKFLLSVSPTQEFSLEKSEYTTADILHSFDVFASRNSDFLDASSVAANLGSSSEADVKGGMNSDAYSVIRASVKVLEKYGAFVNFAANLGSSSEADVPNTEEQHSELERPRSNRR